MGEISQGWLWEARWQHPLGPPLWSYRLYQSSRTPGGRHGALSPVFTDRFCKGVRKPLLLPLRDMTEQVCAHPR